MEEIRFGIRIVKYVRSPFERQILESVQIQQERQHHFLLNSRAEYNRCSLPRLTAKIGEKDYKRWEKEEVKEMEKDERLKEKIIRMKNERMKKQQEDRKQANKERHTMGDKRPKKRQKLEDGGYKEKRGEVPRRDNKKEPQKRNKPENEDEDKASTNADEVEKKK